MNQVRSNDNRKGISILWSTRQISMAISWGILGYVSYFCSNYLGLDTGIVGMLLLASKIIDVISNFVIAYVVDNMHPKAGKGRAWEWNIVPMWIMYVLLYLIPAGWGNGAKYAGIFILYTLINAVCGTFLGCVDTIYFNHAIKNENTRIRVQTFTGGATMAVNLGIGIVMPQLIVRFADKPHSWAIMALMLAVPGTIIGMIRYFTIQEVDQEETEKMEHVTIKETFSAFLTNKYVLIVTLMNFAIQVLGGFGSTVTYYFQYFVGNIGLSSIAGTASMVAIVSLFACVPLAKKFGRTNVLRVAFLICAAGCIMRAQVTTPIPIFISALLVSLVTYPFMSFQSLMLIDCMDYGDHKNGKRVEGAIFAGTSLGTTLGGGVGQAACGLCLSAFGFNGKAAVQTATAMRGIRFCYGILPAALMVLVFVILMFYDLDKKIPQIRMELEMRYRQDIDEVEQFESPVLQEAQAKAVKQAQEEAQAQVDNTAASDEAQKAADEQSGADRQE